MKDKLKEIYELRELSQEIHIKALNHFGILDEDFSALDIMEDLRMALLDRCNALEDELLRDKASTYKCKHPGDCIEVCDCGDQVGLCSCK